MKNPFHLLIFGLFVSTMTLVAQNGNASIIGRIVAEGGNHLAYTRVIFNSPSTGDYLTVYSDSLGYFRFYNLTANQRGILIIKPSDTELESVTSKVIRLAPYERIQAIVGLKKLGSKNNSFESGVRVYRFNHDTKRLSNRARTWLGILNYNPLNVLRNENYIYNTGGQATIMGQIGPVRDISINGHLVTDEWSLTDQLNNSNAFIHGLLPIGLNRQTVLLNSFHEANTYGFNIINTQTNLKHSKKTIAGGKAYTHTTYMMGGETLKYSQSLYQTAGVRIDGSALNYQLQYQVGIEGTFAYLNKNTPLFYQTTSVPFASMFNWLRRSDRPITEFYSTGEQDLQLKSFVNMEYSYRQFDRVKLQLIHNRSFGSLSQLNEMPNSVYKNADIQKTYTQVGLTNINVVGEFSNNVNVTYNNMITENMANSDVLISVADDTEVFNFNNYQNQPEKLMSESVIVSNRLNYGISKNNVAIDLQYKLGRASITNAPYSIQHHFPNVQSICEDCPDIDATLWYNPLAIEGEPTDKTSFAEIRAKFDNTFSFKRDIIFDFGVAAYYYKFLTNPIQSEYLDNTILNNYFFADNVQQSSLPDFGIKVEYYAGSKLFLNEKQTSIDLNASFKIIPPNTGWFSSLVTYHPYQSARVKLDGLNSKQFDETLANLKQQTFNTNNLNQLHILFAPEKTLSLSRSLQFGLSVKHKFEDLFDFSFGGFYQQLMDDISYKDINIDYDLLSKQKVTGDKPIPTYRRKFDELKEVVSLYNTGNGGAAWQFYLGGERIINLDRKKNSLKVEAQYQYGTAQSYNDMISFDMVKQFRNSVANIDQTLNQSFNDPGHRFNLGVQYKYVYKDFLETRVNLNYNLQSGRRFTYVFSDLGRRINSDKMFNTNRVYVPKQKGDLHLIEFKNSAGETVSVNDQWKRLLYQVNNDSHLESKMGGLADINGARLPIQQWLDLRISNTYLMTHKNLVTFDIVFHNVLGMISESLNPLYVAYNNVIPLLNYEGTQNVNGQEKQVFTYRHTSENIFPKMSDSRYNMGSSGISVNLGISF